MARRTDSLSVFVVAMILLISGCSITVRVKDVNTDLFAGPQDIEEKSNGAKNCLQIDHGMLENDVFLCLAGDTERIPLIKERFGPMEPGAIQMALYPSSRVTGFPEDMERHKDRAKKFRGYSAEYKHNEKIWEFYEIYKLNVTVFEKGYRYKIVLIFDEGDCKNEEYSGPCGLTRVVLAKNPINSRDKIYFYEMIVNLLTGFLQQGSKSAVKAFGL